MQKKAPCFRSTVEIATADLEWFAEGWLLDSDMRQLSAQTVAARRFLIDKLLWFLHRNQLTLCGSSELRAFLAYVSRGHETPEGRWGNPANRDRVKPGTVHTYHGNLRTLFRFLVAEGTLEESPMEALRAPVVRKDQVQPFTPEQLEALLAAAKRSRHPRRDELILLFLLDTGARASELCSLRVRDLDLTARRCTVLGKGNKSRALCFGARTTRALWAYLRAEERDPDTPLFTADAGHQPGEALTRSGLLQLIKRLGKSAGVECARCSPHTFRHTFAVSFLRNGGNVFTLKELLGHTTLAMVNRYVVLAQADLENQHRQFSPVDRMGKR